MTTFRTRQEIFDLAWVGLKAQGFFKSITRDGNCAYRGTEGLRCAIGFCIEDENYDADLLEGLSAENPDVLAAARVDETDREFADDLQETHDSADTPEIMERRLRSFAERHNLTVPA